MSQLYFGAQKFSAGVCVVWATAVQHDGYGYAYRVERVPYVTDSVWKASARSRVGNKPIIKIGLFASADMAKEACQQTHNKQVLNAKRLAARTLNQENRKRR